MAGGLMTLISEGPENIILNGNPKKTFFKATYNKYTNFGMQKFRIDYEGQRRLHYDEPTELIFKVPRYADLIFDTYVVVNSVLPIKNIKFKLKDLKSRAKSFVNLGIELPTDDLLRVIISKYFSDKQINVEKKHIDYIIKRIDRSYEKISQFILTLDKYSLKKGSPFGLKLIKEVLKMI